MDAVLKKIREEISKRLSELSIVVDDLEYVKENNYNCLRITLDKTNGLDMDQIVEATNIINPLIDELDLIKDEYILDISSKERGN